MLIFFVIQPDQNDDERETYVGLKNEDSTCYKNVVIQTLYHIPYLRKMVYQIPAKEPSVILALQKLFCHLEFNKNSGSTKDLTKSLEVDDYHSVLQGDAQEFSSYFRVKLQKEVL